VTRLHSKEPEELIEDIQSFLANCRAPAVLEEGEELMSLREGEYAVEIRSGRLWLEVWHSERALSRRILSVEPGGVGALQCLIQKFGGTTGKLTFLDTAKPQTGAKRMSGERKSFAEQFRRMLYRQFPGFTIRTLTTGMDLQRSFSPVFPRAVLVRGSHQIIAMVAPTADDEAALLTFASIWFDYQRQRSAPGLRNEVALFLPASAGCLTAQRLRWLTLPARMFRFNEHGSAGEIDPQDLGNLDTRLVRASNTPELRNEVRALLGRLAAIENVSLCPEPGGAVSIRYRGAEWARFEDGNLAIGLQTKEILPVRSWDRAEEFVSQLALANYPPAEERWLEGELRSEISRIDACLRPEPVHGQVITFAGSDRDLIDLLALTYDGRLAVLELKAKEDIHLPFQALDYWMRVRWHAQRGELGSFFPGVPIRPEPPLLRLIAPALSFHSTHASVLRYFSPQIDVERIGLNWNWSEHLKVVLRLRGADEPQCHGGSELECRDY
jgi:hypothetical protein